MCVEHPGTKHKFGGLDLKNPGSRDFEKRGRSMSATMVSRRRKFYVSDSINRLK